MLLRQAKAIIETIDEVEGGKEQADKAKAAATLLEKYRLLSGEPESSTEVRNVSGWFEEELDEFLEDALSDEDGSEISPGDEDME